jgi:phosphate uptake regulator
MRDRRRVPRDHAPAHQLHDGGSAHDHPALEIIFIAKSIERIGDHAKNIAEAVVQVVKGIDVRHASAEQIRAKSRQ